MINMQSYNQLLIGRLLYRKSQRITRNLGELLRKDVGSRLYEEVTFQLRSEGYGGGTKCTSSRK